MPNRLQEDHTFSCLPLGPRFLLLVHGKGAGSPAAQVGLRTTLLDRCARRRGELLIPTRFQRGGKDSGGWYFPANALRARGCVGGPVSPLHPRSAARGPLRYPSRPSSLARETSSLDLRGSVCSALPLHILPGHTARCGAASLCCAREFRHKCA